MDKTDTSETFKALAAAIEEVDETLQEEVQATEASDCNFFVGKPQKNFIFSVIEGKPKSLHMWKGKAGCPISKLFSDEKKFLDTPYLPILDPGILEEAERGDDDLGDIERYLLFSYAVFDNTAPGNIGAYGLWPIRLDYTRNEWWNSAVNAARKARKADVWCKLKANTSEKSYELTMMREREEFPAPKSMPFDPIELIGKCFGPHLVVTSKEHKLIELLRDPFALAVPNVQ